MCWNCTIVHGSIEERSLACPACRTQHDFPVGGVEGYLEQCAAAADAAMDAQPPVAAREGVIHVLQIALTEAIRRFDPTRAALLADVLLATVSTDELVQALQSRESMMVLVNWASAELHTPLDTAPFVAAVEAGDGEGAGAGAGAGGSEAAAGSATGIAGAAGCAHADVAADAAAGSTAASGHDGGGAAAPHASTGGSGSAGTGVQTPAPAGAACDALASVLSAADASAGAAAEEADAKAEAEELRAREAAAKAAAAYWFTSPPAASAAGTTPASAAAGDPVTGAADSTTAAALLPPLALLPKLTARISADSGGSRSRTASGLGRVVDVSVTGASPSGAAAPAASAAMGAPAGPVSVNLVKAGSEAGGASGSSSREGSGSSREGSRSSALLLPSGNVLLGDAGCGVLRPLAQWSSSRSGSTAVHHGGAVVASSASSASSSRSGTLTFQLSPESASVSAPATAPSSRFSSAAASASAGKPPLPSAHGGGGVSAFETAAAATSASASAVAAARADSGTGVSVGTTTHEAAAGNAMGAAVLAAAAVAAAAARTSCEVGIMTDPLPPLQPMPQLPQLPVAAAVPPAVASGDAVKPGADSSSEQRGTNVQAGPREAAVPSASTVTPSEPPTGLHDQGAPLAGVAPSSEAQPQPPQQPQPNRIADLLRQVISAGPSAIGRIAEECSRLVGEAMAPPPAPRGLCEVLWDMSGPCDPPPAASIHAMLTDLKKTLVVTGRHHVHDRFHVTAVRATERPGARDFMPRPTAAPAPGPGPGPAHVAAADHDAGGAAGGAGGAHGGAGAGGAAAVPVQPVQPALSATGVPRADLVLSVRATFGLVDERKRVTELTRNLVTIVEAGSGSRSSSWEAARACSAKMRERIGEIERRVQHCGLRVATVVVITSDQALQDDIRRLQQLRSPDGHMVHVVLINPTSSRLNLSQLLKSHSGNFNSLPYSDWQQRGIAGIATQAAVEPTAEAEPSSADASRASTPLRKSRFPGC